MPRLFVLFLIALSNSTAVARESRSQVPAGVDERIKVSVVPHGATVDGQIRNDISQAVGDSISAYLIKAGTYRVYDSMEAPRPPRRKKAASYAGANPESDQPLAQPAPAAGSDFIFAHSLLGDAGSHRLTLKKIQADTAEVIAIEETSSTGGLESVLSSIPALMQRLDSKGRREVVFPQSQSPAQVRETIRPARPVQATPPGHGGSPGLREYSQAASRAPLEYGGVPLSSVPKALVYQRLGAIEWINETWKFCIIQPQSGHRFAMNQPLDVLYDEDGKPYGSLSVDALDSGKVVAGFGRTPSHHPLFRGDVVYGWAPPLR